MKLKPQLYLILLTPLLLLALAPRDVAPPFAVKNQNGDLVRLSDLKGKFVLLYFYPKDDTPGCTQEACSFRDEYAKLKKLNTIILGVSRQGEKSHQEFRTKHKLPFDLLVDSEGTLANAYQVGTVPVLGFLKRRSVLIDPEGKVAQVYDSVDPSKHALQVIEDIQRINNK